MGPAWFDTHVHLSDPKFDADRDAVVDRTFEAGIAGLIEIADGPSEWLKAQTLSEKHPGRIWWAAGLHPYFADLASQDLWDSLKILSKHPHFVALGEVGLDYAKCPIPKEKQIETFRSALEVANEINKPLIIHCRDAYSDLLPILNEKLPINPHTSPGVIHCFSGTQQDAEAMIKLGFFLGVDGPITYPKSDELRRIFSTIPIESIVIETDSPYLPPQAFRGQRNDPGRLSHIGNKLAELRSLLPAILSKQLRHNSDKLFRLNSVGI